MTRIFFNSWLSPHVTKTGSSCHQSKCWVITQLNVSNFGSLRIHPKYFCVLSLVIRFQTVTAHVFQLLWCQCVPDQMKCFILPDTAADYTLAQVSHHSPDCHQNGPFTFKQRLVKVIRGRLSLVFFHRIRRCFADSLYDIY